MSCDEWDQTCEISGCPYYDNSPGVGNCPFPSFNPTVRPHDCRGKNGCYVINNAGKRLTSFVRETRQIRAASQKFTRAISRLPQLCSRAHPERAKPVRARVRVGHSDISAHFHADSTPQSNRRKRRKVHVHGNNR